MDEEEKARIRRLVAQNKRQLKRLNLAMLVVLTALIPIVLTIASLKYKFVSKIGATEIQFESDGWISEIRDWASILLPMTAAGAGFSYYRSRNKDEEEE